MLLDTSIPQQKYIEDCEVCCNPIELTLGFEARELVQFSADTIDQ